MTWYFWAAALLGAALAAWLGARRLRAAAGEGPDPGRRRRAVLHGVGALLLAALCYRLPLQDVAASLASAGPEVFGAYGLHLAEVLVAVVTFSILSGWRAPISDLVSIHLISNTVSALVPVWYSGEPYRIARFSRWMPLGEAGRWAVTEELVNNSAALAFNGLVVAGALALHPLAPAYAAPLALAAGAQAVVALALAAAALSPAPSKATLWVLRKLRLADSVPADPLGWSRFLKALGVKLCGGFVVLAEFWLIFRALGVSPTAGQLLAFCALHWVAMTVFIGIPYSLGVLEGSITLGVVALGLPPHLGLAVALVRRGGEVLWTLVGLGLYLLPAPGPAEAA